jgi:hypothetical protein
MPGLGPTPKLLASHKVNPKRVPNVPLYDEEEDEDDTGGPPPIVNTDESHHPIDLKEGMLEKLVKLGTKLSGNYFDKDEIYLEQYLHPERDVIPKQTLRPRKGLVPSGMEVRRLPEDEPMKVGGHTLKRYPAVDGLGRYTKSRGDKYNSAYDEWDFDTDSDLFSIQAGDSPLSSAANWAAKKFMQNIGTPFAVYERYNKDEMPEMFEPDWNMMKDLPGTATPLEEFEYPGMKKKKGKK